MSKYEPTEYDINCPSCGKWFKIPIKNEKAKKLAEELKQDLDGNCTAYQLELLNNIISALDKPVCQTCSNGKGKGWFTCPVCKQPVYQQPPDDEFTKECRELIKTDDDDKGWERESGYIVWLEVKLEGACSRLDSQRRRIKELEKKNMKYGIEDTTIRKGVFGYAIKADETLSEGIARNYNEFNEERGRLEFQLAAKQQKNEELEKIIATQDEDMTTLQHKLELTDEQK